jgi:hypothetical protein
MASAKKKSDRKCGFCGKLGHDKRTCVEKKNADSVTKAYISQGRKDLKEYFMSIGLGIGSVISRRVVIFSKDQTASFKDIVAIVTHIDLKDLLVDNNIDVITYSRLDDLNSTSLSDFGIHSKYNVNGTKIKVVKPTSQKEIQNMFDKAYNF